MRDPRCCGRDGARDARDVRGGACRDWADSQRQLRERGLRPRAGQPRRRGLLDAFTALGGLDWILNQATGLSGLPVVASLTSHFCVNQPHGLISAGALVGRVRVGSLRHGLQPDLRDVVEDGVLLPGLQLDLRDVVQDGVLPPSLQLDLRDVVQDGILPPGLAIVRVLQWLIHVYNLHGRLGLVGHQQASADRLAGHGPWRCLLLCVGALAGLVHTGRHYGLRLGADSPLGRLRLGNMEAGGASASA
mmetsp:Transcript_4196/g.13491  ORF Transcript_4196/g.13491 Transcript_4196/m.13491 type:complete len:247 (+) Transcript_4196:704-1444(+)